MNRLIHLLVACSFATQTLCAATTSSCGAPSDEHQTSRLVVRISAASEGDDIVVHLESVNRGRQCRNGRGLTGSGSSDHLSYKRRDDHCPRQRERNAVFVCHKEPQVVEHAVREACLNLVLSLPNQRLNHGPMGSVPLRIKQQREGRCLLHVSLRRFLLDD
jgi:hypothetical protein